MVFHIFHSFVSDSGWRNMRFRSAVVLISLVSRVYLQQCLPPSSDNAVLSPDLLQYNAQDQVTITCDIGHYLSLQINTMTCTSGLWQPTPPTCIQYVCADVSFPNTITTSSGPYYHSDRPTFTCETQYYMRDISSLVCASGNWLGTQPFCADVECTPIDVDNAGEALTADPLIHGEQLRIRCDYGYQQTGDTDLTCDTSGGSGVLQGVVPSCTQITCTGVNVQNGNIANSGPYYLDSQLSYICDVGYNIQGSALLTCLDTGSFDSSPPACNPVECAEPRYPNMVISTTGPYYYEDGVTFQCNVGYYMSTTSASLRCDPDGNWEGVSPFCTKIECQIPVIPYSTFDTLGPYYDGDLLGVTCDYIYELQGEDILECDGTSQPGTWTQTLPTCEPIICTPQSIINGFYDVTSGGDGSPYYRGESIYYECVAGYMVSGTDILTCREDRSWDVPAPECVRSVCAPIAVSQSSIITSLPYYWTDTVTYKCNKGYNISGAASIACGPRGEWAEAVPACTRNQCTPTDIVGGIVTSTGPYYMNNKITYQCKPAFYMVGPGTIDCNEHGRYASAAPTCKLVTCTPYQPVNATYLQSGPFYIGDEIVYHCKYGLSLEGSNTLICAQSGDNSASGIWLGDEPSCVNADLRPFIAEKSKAWIAAVVLGALLALGLLTLLLWWFCCRRRRKVIKRVHQHAVQKPARQAHHRSCHCASCTKSRHHADCKCQACLDHQKYKHHDEFKCGQCKKAYIHRAGSDKCSCKDCKEGRKHRQRDQCACKSCVISRNHMAAIICDCKNCTKTVKHVETNTECNCEKCSKYHEHKASKRWEHTKSCHSCRVSFEHDKRHTCTCNSCVATNTHQNKHACHCEDCDSGDVHRLHGNCMCESCLKMEPQAHRVKQHYRQECQCAACTAPKQHAHHHHHVQKGCDNIHCTDAHCSARSCSKADHGTHHHHTHTPVAPCNCELCAPKTTPKPTLPHCDCNKCATAREYNHKSFCECPMCMTAHQHTHTNECDCQHCVFFLQYGGHATCMTCQDPSVPMQAMRCTDKNCRRCVGSPVKVESPPPPPAVREKPKRVLEGPKDAGPRQIGQVLPFEGRLQGSNNSDLDFIMFGFIAPTPATGRPSQGRLLEASRPELTHATEYRPAAGQDRI